MASNTNNTTAAGHHVAFAPLPVAELIHDDDDNDKVDRHPLQEDLAQVPTLTADGSLPVVAAVPSTTFPPTSPSTFVTTTRSPHQGPFRDGFSTSVCEGLFADPHDRTSCCALTCCATFMQDRNRLWKSHRICGVNDLEPASVLFS